MRPLLLILMSVILFLGCSTIRKNESNTFNQSEAMVKTNVDSLVYIYRDSIQVKELIRVVNDTVIINKEIFRVIYKDRDREIIKRDSIYINTETEVIKEVEIVKNKYPLWNLIIVLCLLFLLAYVSRN